MENSINIVHEVTSFKARVNYHIQIFIGAISVFGLLFFFGKNQNNFLLFISIVALLFGILIGSKIYKNRLYLADFCSDSNTVKIVYFDCSEEQKLETTIDNVAVKLKETTSKSNFNFELILIINDLKFTVEKTFDWNFTEMKNVFGYIRFHNNVPLTDKEK